MALTATFAADFSQFESSLQQATVKLQGFERATSTASRDLNRAVSEFSGQKVAVEAARMAEAVERVGGVSKLTAAEQEKVNRVMTEAAEKFRALGQEVPKGIAALEDATRRVPTQNKSILDSLTPLAGAFGVAFSVGTVINMGKAILDNADAVQKLSDKTGIAIEPLQTLKFAAEQSGNSFEQVTKAITMMQQRVAGGNDSAIGALRGLGISLEEFQRMTPDQQFTAIAREVAKIQDPMERVRVATELFGKAGAEILPTLVSDIDALADAAPKMSEKAIRAFDAIGDTWDRLTTAGMNFAGETVSTMIDGFDRMARSLGALATGELQDFVRIMNDAEVVLPQLPPTLDGIGASAGAASLSLAEMARIEKELTETAAESIRLSERKKQIQDALFGRDLIARANDYVDALGGVENITKLTDEKKKELTRTIEAAIKQYQALGEKAPPELLKIKNATFDLDAEMAKLNEKTLPAFAGIIGKIDTTLDPLPVDLGAIRTELRFTAETIAQEVVPQLAALDERIARTVTSWQEAMERVRRGQGTMTAQGRVMSLADFDAQYMDLYLAARALAPLRDPRDIEEELRRSRQRIIDAQPRALADGGTAFAGRTHLVGERGPELFVPNRNGAVVPNHRLGGTSITFAPVLNGPVFGGNKQQVARELFDAFESYLRGGGMRFATGA